MRLYLGNVGCQQLMGEKRRFEEIVEYLCKRDDEQITISKLNDMIKEEVSRKPYFIFVIYYEGLLAFNMSHIILLPLNLIIMVIILSIFIRISVVLLNMNLVLLLMP